MTPNSAPSALRLTPMQQGMLYHHLVDESGGLDLLQIVLDLPEPVEPEVLERAWNHVVEAHPALRAAVRVDGDGRASWEVREEARVGLHVLDWTGRASSEIAPALEALIQEDRARGFEVDRAPLMRLTLVRLAPDHYRCIWTVPHIVLDAGSFSAVLGDAWKAYEALRRGVNPELPSVPSYTEYLEWRSARSGEGDREFWRGLLAGFTTPTDVSAGGVAQPPSHGEIERRLSAGLRDRLLAKAEASGVTMSTLVLAAWGIVLSRFAREDDVVFGVTRAGRAGTVEGADAMVGLFINTVPMRMRFAADTPVSALLRAVREQQVAVRPHEHASLADIQAWSDVPRGTPLFQTIVVFDRESLETRLRSLGDGWSRRGARLRQRLNSPLTLNVYGDEPIAVAATWERRVFGEERVRALLDALHVVLDRLAEPGDRELREISTLGGEARRQVLEEWNETRRPLPEERRIHAQFVERAARCPDDVAVRSASRALTYAELDHESNRLARHLVGLGVGPGHLVGLATERSVEMVVALLGILKAGAAYVPLDPAYPPDRLALMIEDSGLGVLVTLRRHVAMLPEHGARVVLADPDGRAFSESAEPLEPRAEETDVAYVIYTSGSTGRPKGVAVEHRNVTAFFAAMDEKLGATPPRKVWLSVTTLSFDISVLELLWTLTRGFEVALYDDGRGDTGVAPARESRTGRRPTEFSLFYFSSDEGEQADDRYELLLKGARFADEHGFSAVWTPERHFHAFGGLYPNPSVTGAALAAITKHVQIRAGSVVLPLHHPVRVAEEWAVVDNISGGRVGVAFASGWQPDDFCIRPDDYANRKEYLYEAIETVRALWRGERRTFKGPLGDVEVRTLPRPVQQELPVWVTTAGSPESFESAGRAGAHLLTHLLGQSVEEVAEKIAIYRDAWRKAGHRGEGCVSLMLHTFVGEDEAEVRRLVREPMKRYLKSAASLMKNFAQAYEIYQRGSAREADAKKSWMDGLTPEDLDALLEFAFERYYESSGLFGSLDRCMDMVERLRAIGVDDFACLIDFGVDTRTTLAHLEDLAELRRRVTETAARREPTLRTFAGQVRAYGVSHLQCTPSMARLLLAEPGGREAFGSLDTVMLGGEALPAPLAQQVRATGVGRLLNMYGPTETTIWSAVHEVGPGDAHGTVPIGRPIANTRFYVVDQALQPVPVGVAGELLIGGEGVARGYLRRPELTAERFLVDPFAGDARARMYRTGDLVRYRPDGVLDFLGRIDHQVKVRGHRIELGEIDAALTAEPGVKAAVTVVKQLAEDDLRIVSYVVTEDDDRPSDKELRAGLRKRLPEAMIPSTIVRMEALPTTPNGKIDRKALPEAAPLRRTKTASPVVAPRSELEATIARIWAEELGVTSLSIDQNFFDAGGHSLLAVQVQARLQAELARPVSLTDLFRYPTVRRMAEHLADGGEGAALAAAAGVDRAALRRAARRRSSSKPS
jgi:natural product biosynthesis luciferase-like monooxygenase protein